MKTQGVNSICTTAKIVVAMLFMPFFILGQSNDTLQKYEEVVVKVNHAKVNQHSTLSETQIDRLAPHDVGTLLQYINGITIKNYGGIGGMKTLSHRGLGGEHTQLIVDGFPVNDPQTGQINFAAIQPNNIEEVSANHQNKDELLPVSGLIKGSDVQLKTFDQQFSLSPLSVRSSLTLGSFGQKEAYLALKKGGKNNFISFSGGVGSYDGDYPYTLTTIEGEEVITRKNNALSSYHISLGSGFKWGKKKTRHLLKFSAKTNFIDQQLSGAVVLYNDLSKETMKTQNSSVGTNYTLLSKSWKLIAFGNYANRFLHYHDPNYLNIDGFIDNQYKVNSLLGGFHLQYKWKKIFFQMGSDLGYDVLESNKNLGNPTRVNHTSMGKIKYKSIYFSVEASLFSQIILDDNRSAEHRNNYYKIHPQLALFTSDRLFKDWQLFAWYKPSSRAPSFNDLYFSQIGNKSLVPEESSQINVGFNYVKNIRRFALTIQGNAFKNIVKNKIIALPTKNLFIWSIQNVGKVDIYGGDFNFIGNVKFNSDWTLHLQTGVSYQKAIDISNTDAPTYRHQIAYTPELTGNAILSASYKRLGLHLSSLYIGKRYSLNENIPSNLLDSYFTMDVSGSYAYSLNNRHTFKLHAGIKNVTNASYSFVRYFIMPGINYFIKLSYDFN